MSSKRQSGSTPAKGSKRKKLSDEPTKDDEYVNDGFVVSDSEPVDADDVVIVDDHATDDEFDQEWPLLPTGFGSAFGGVGEQDSGDEYEDDGVEYVDGRGTKKKTRAKGMSKKAQSQLDLPAVKDCSDLVLKPDHKSRPIWVSNDARIFLETFSPIYATAYDFLIAIAEPVNRPRCMHEYRLTAESLYAAVSVGLHTDGIIDSLNKMSKIELSAGVKEFIRNCTESCGKIKLVLKQNRYFLESRYPDVLRTLLKNPIIQAAHVTAEERQKQEQALLESQAPRRGLFKLPGSAAAHAAKNAASSLATSTAASTVSKDGIETTVTGPVEDVPEDLRDVMDKLNRDDETGGDDELANHKVHSFEIRREKVEHVKKLCTVDLSLPIVEEYDFRNDDASPQLDIDLKPLTTLRPYQEKALNKMFGNGRGRSGVIVLPCGAGKTLVGVTATCTVKKRTLVLTTNAVSVEQWRSEFRKWANIPYEKIAVFTATVKDNLKGMDCGIVISTYTMFSFQGKRSYEAELIMKEIQSHEWGLLILDEVHVVPANMFRKVLHETVGAHCKLGLSATLVREDDHIADLSFLVGPKMYEANWMDLQRKGYIARVSCAEVWCPMTPEFYRKYLEVDGKKKSLLWTMNPNKFRATQYLVDYHTQRGDKVIVFSDDLFTLKTYANKLKKYYLYGATSQNERMEVLEKFKKDPKVNCIFCSKIADNAIDLPDANVLIQISSHYGSRRQEAQRLGRILRAKKGHINDEFNAYFYTLVSQDTQEMYYSLKRQQFLVDQGYAFKVLTSLPPTDSPGLYFSSLQEQRDLLATVMAANDGDIGEENSNFYDADGSTKQIVKAPVMTAKGSAGAVAANLAAQQVSRSLSAMSGGATMSYMEVSGSPVSTPGRKAAPKQSKVMGKLLKDAKKASEPKEFL